ncbi:class I SAM-dependent methyltransferase [Nitrosomonas cryotolerans]|uniref:SAM-dependent methyltransferase n=1 Tax=Nitrosomonas cryotolerans ATCC 49181 TaxID=1131553 RepID=A0A1N6G1Y0_9PROT|nr:class I SAM-dependent methyltransferase [Nitrosomonas cryotolerans]SIO01487.1 SAM-dependent methyltransferase [Nitrosomonas cryotolerans ATCC 49181]
MTSAESTSIFTHSWSLYDLITEYNYMFHQEIYTGVGQLLKLRDDLGRYRLLDLGCGNARYLSPCLKQSPPILYEGVDLSEAALAEARGYLAGLPDPVVTLTRGDLLEAVEATDKTWDVIFTGFAVHHLMSADKARFFQAAGRCLAEKGWLILVDVVREENQSRENYLMDYLNYMRDNWNKIPPDQLEEACTHVHDHDYPEYFSTLKEMAAAGGLKASRIVSRYGQHYTLLFARSSLPQI